MNTRNKHHLHGPNANLACFQKSTFYADINFSTSPLYCDNPQELRGKISLTLRQYLHTHFYYSVDKFFMCKDLYCFCKMCVVFYTVSSYMCIYDLFHILLSLWYAYGSMGFVYFGFRDETPSEHVNLQICHYYCYLKCFFHFYHSVLTMEVGKKSKAVLNVQSVIYSAQYKVVIDHRHSCFPQQ